MPVSKFNFLVFYCFMNFLCISLFFWPFVFAFFSVKFVADTFWSTIMLKTNLWISAIESKLSIFIWTMWKKKSICIDFVHKITFWSHYSVRSCMSKSYVSSEPYPRASQILCQNVRETWKKKSHKVSRRELCALQSNRGELWNVQHFRCAPPQSCFQS